MLSGLTRVKNSTSPDFGSDLEESVQKTLALQRRKGLGGNREPTGGGCSQNPERSSRSTPPASGRPQTCAVASPAAAAAAAAAVAASPKPEGLAPSGRRPDTSWAMSAQGDCEFLVQRARELVQQDLWAAKAWLITARSLYPADFNIQVRAGPAQPPGEVRAARCAGRPGLAASGPARPALSFSRFWRPPPRPVLPHLSPALPRAGPAPGDAASPPEVGSGRRGVRCGAACAGTAPRRHRERPFGASFIAMAAVCSAPAAFETLFH